MATRTVAAAGGNWNATATWGGAAVPTAADDVVLNATSGQLTINVAAVCRSINCTGYTNTLTHAASVTLTIGDATAGTGNVALKFVAGMTYTKGNIDSSALSFVSTSATVQTVDLAGKNPGRVTFNGAGGSWQLVSSLVQTSGNSNFTHTAGTFDSNGQAVTIGQYTSTGATARTLTLGASTWTLLATGVGNPWTVSGSNFTLNSGTSLIIFQSSTAFTYAMGAFTYYDLQWTGGTTGTINITGAFTCRNLTRNPTGGTGQAATLLSADITVTGTFTSTGGNTTLRIVVWGSTAPGGTRRTITAAAVSLTDTHFQDIAGAGAATWSGTRLGDLTGNTGITFTTPVTRYWVGGTGSWSSTTHWSTSSGGATGASVPLPQDSVIVDNSSGSGAYTVTLDMRYVAALNASAVTTGSITATFSIGISPTTFTRDVTFSARCALLGSNDFELANRGTSTFTQAMPASAWGHTGSIVATTGGGTLRQGDDVDTGANTAGLVGANATWDTNGHNLRVNRVTEFGGPLSFIGSAGKTLTLWGTNATVFPTLTGTLTPNSMNVTINNATANGSSTFNASNKTWGDLHLVSNGRGISFVITHTGATFGIVTIDSGALLTLTSAQTLTVSDVVGTGSAFGYIYLPGVSGNYLNTPDTAALSIVNDIDIRVKVALDDWTPAGSQDLLTKWGVSPNISYAFQVLATGSLALFISTTGSDFPTVSSSVATGIADGAVKWCRVTRRKSDGRVQFFTSNDGSAWTQLGTDVTLSSNVAMWDSAAAVEIGGQTAGTAGLGVGKYYRAQIRNNILDDGTGIVFDADLTAKAIGAATFTESSTNAATVTVNGDIARTGDGGVGIRSSTAATAATMSKTSGTTVVRGAYIRDSTVTGGTWYAPQSQNVSNNTGWLFSDPLLPNGAASTATAGTIAFVSNVDLGMGGVASTATAGAIAFGANVAFTVNGAPSTAVAGGLAPFGAAATLPVNGAPSTATAGSITFGADVGLGLAGVASTATAGAITFTAAATLPLNGAPSTATAGSITFGGAVTVGLDSAAPTSSAGPITFDADVVLALDGVASTSTAGTIGLEVTTVDQFVAFAGAASTATAGPIRLYLRIADAAFAATLTTRWAAVGQTRLRTTLRARQTFTAAVTGRGQANVVDRWQATLREDVDA